MRATTIVIAVLASLAIAVPAADAAWIPNDPGISGEGWQADQWNFLPGTGVDAPRAWDNLFRAGRPGGKGVTIAVLDSGVAYRNHGRFKKSPDLKSIRFKHPRDFCPRPGIGEDACVGEDSHPDDDYGHGTHVTSTIVETPNNGKALTGLAYGATIIPVKVLNSAGDGDEDSIAKGIRYAARHGAQIINLSFEFSSSIDSASDIPRIASAAKYARRKGALIVAAAGNASFSRVAYPAALPGVVSVGAVTEHGCLARYSNTGPGLDLVGPGGGDDATLPGTPCQGAAGRPIFQLTLNQNKRSFGYPTDYYGTSMAAPQVSATAALIIASGVLGPHPTANQVEQRLKATARDLGAPGPDEQYGAGLVDAGAATAR